MENILSVNNLVVGFEADQGDLQAVKGVSLELYAKETLALVGESGCGKTVLCKSIMKLLCQKGRVSQGEIRLGNQDLIPLGDKEMQARRGADVAMIFQDPMTSLDPTMPVGRQIAEVMEIHGLADRRESKRRALELMELVQIGDPEIRYDQMPHEFSGGMRQRIAIAIALAGEPKVLLADEPTTALDQDTREQILTLLTDVQKKTKVATIFITHDLSLVEGIADRVAIMKDGVIVESGPVADVFAAPSHAYTKKLLGYLDYEKKRGHQHKHFDTAREPLVEARNLRKVFSLGSHASHTVFDGLNMDIYKGEILGLVGPSGCGKSTLARCIMEMFKPDGGTIKFYNTKQSRNWKQMIFQDSVAALNPRMTVERIIGEPLRIATGIKPDSEAVASLMKQVELDPILMERHPSEISGGQRQRVAIARALSVDPELIIADEPISSLDVSTQAQIVHLLRKLQEERNLTILFIAHDLPMVNHISDRVVEL